MQIQTGMRRGLRAAVAGLALWSGLAQALTVTDMAGRSVQVPDRV
ncbi:MAG TPA: iron ABC transporter substrate-binding protein, partial [Delftia acidovorans]|nr:iron ABC transporter substrate-binding protein [Delftia acidovorans]